MVPLSPTRARSGDRGAGIDTAASRLSGLRTCSVERSRFCRMGDKSSTLLTMHDRRRCKKQSVWARHAHKTAAMPLLTPEAFNETGSHILACLQLSDLSRERLHEERGTWSIKPLHRASAVAMMADLSFQRMDRHSRGCLTSRPDIIPDRASCSLYDCWRTNCPRAEGQAVHRASVVLW